ncbi:disease resistance protein SUMM2-like [Vigna unguiculata]|uniref:disease resistance protein SUMM2-like n=1 Tax=Vigna unguiculata TaxID=3917 RepID=UPI001016AE02|nr:disease resistance protein SUMM2-like [Vigna unguiculata]
MDTVLKIVDPVIEFVRDHGINQLTYIFCYTKYFEELNKRVKRLGEEKERLDRQRDEAKRKGDIVEDRVEEWFEEVGEFESRVEKYMNNAGHKKTRGLYYLFPYYRHKLGRQAKKMEPEALRLKDECPKDDEVSHAEKVTSFDLTSSYSGYIEFDSRKSIVDDIMTKLKDPNMKIIGLHGAQGMGKSTLIKKIANKAKDEGLFDRVAEIDVTEYPNPLTIQADIAHVLGLPLAGESENVRADYLRRWLKIENVSILIILDNLHERLDLNRLGIPVDDDYDLRKKNELSISNQKTASDKQGTSGDKQGTGAKVLKKTNFLGDYKGCKVLLSSRDKNVFRDEVDVESNFCLKELDGNDALMLFEKVTGGGNKMSMPKEEIQNYCTGLPMRIVTLAVAFKNWIESESKPTLDKFKKQGLVEWQKSSETPNKKKYDLPKNKELKFIYLLCAQMGHLPLVNDLVKYCFGLGIFEGVSSLSAAREKINESLQELKNLGLVSYENPNIHFHMSHMVRDDALSNALMDHNVFAFRDGKLDYWPDLEKCISISICNSYITDGFPHVINCPQLQFLQIETIDPSLEIPQRFFSSMKNLLVLILAGFHLSSLPYSIEDLLNLRMLCLERCTLDCNLSVLRKFKKLRILSFSGSQLKNLPVELRYLDKLRMLDISDCFKLEIIPLDLFSNLTCLEELYIRKSLIKMLVEKWENEGHNSFLSELKNLHQLKVVDLSIPCVSILPNHLFFDRLKDYKIEIGDFEMFSVGEFRMPNKYEELKVLALQLKDDTDIHSHQGIKLLFKTTQSLFLGNVCVQNVVNELNIDEFQNLKHLSIINNNDVEYFNSTDLSYCVNIFSNLESLYLYNMMKLKMICRGPITLESFAKLKTIKVEMCCQLENLFSFYAIKISTSTGTSEIFKCNSNMKKFLASLEMIEVCECESLKEILQIPPDCVKDCECESLKEILQIPQDYGKVEFLKLRTLTLQSLPSFTCFYTKVERYCWPYSTEAQTTNRCHTEISTEEDGHSDNAPPLFGEPVEVPNLENLNLSSLNIRKIWSDQHLSSFYFQNLIKLVVKDCDKLTHLCSLPMASSMKKLKSLVISGCLKMEKIFEIEGISANKVCVFPKLEEIHLSKMKRLTDMWQTEVGIDSFSSLISVRIEECDQLDKIFPSHMEGWFESLINLQISKCKSVEEIFEINDSQEIDASGGIDTNLQVILLEELPKLKELWSKDPDGILNFKKLRTIDVSYCDELRNLFPASVAKDVPKLERMSVLYCERMMEIVSNKDTSEADNDPLEFPELTFVRLYGLPTMKQFYKGRHPIKCPKLKELSMGKCTKLKTFLQETSDEKFVFSAEEVSMILSEFQKQKV